MGPRFLLESKVDRTGKVSCWLSICSLTLQFLMLALPYYLIAISPFPKYVPYCITFKESHTLALHCCSGSLPVISKACHHCLTMFAVLDCAQGNDLAILWVSLPSTSLEPLFEDEWVSLTLFIFTWCFSVLTLMLPTRATQETFLVHTYSCWFCR